MRGAPAAAGHRAPRRGGSAESGGTFIARLAPAQRRDQGTARAARVHWRKCSRGGAAERVQVGRGVHKNSRRQVGISHVGHLRHHCVSRLCVGGRVIWRHVASVVQRDLGHGCGRTGQGGGAGSAEPRRRVSDRVSACGRGGSGGDEIQRQRYCQELPKKTGRARVAVRRHRWVRTVRVAYQDLPQRSLRRCCCPPAWQRAIHLHPGVVPAFPSK
mmetsp:Transcript_13469/g.25906  ORF Transcript_13469/g.25906 Transcript_13469/m.25906 type:complete len:215 (-) Transcript_13469:1793-2437(-)